MILTRLGYKLRLTISAGHIYAISLAAPGSPSLAWLGQFL